VTEVLEDGGPFRRVAAPPETRPRFAPWRLLAVRAVSLLVVATGLAYLYWRLSTFGDTGALGVAFYTVEVINFGLLVLTAVLFVQPRERQAPTAPPAGTLDVFITVCGEPVELVEESLRGALAIAYPHETYLLNDGLIAAKENWRAIEALADRYGVRCFTRTKGVKAKAGNLNHALPRTSGEFVAVIDCDHRADPLFAHELLGYFADSEVGFVTTRQEFHGEDADLLGARDPLFYNWQQPAKDSGNAAFSTGNAVVYRRAALDSSGGFSEWSIVEDLHTSMRIHERGWRSVYHNRPVTVGVAPDTSAALVQQRLTWATDSTRIFLFDNPLLKRGLTLKQKLHYAHTTGYNLVACTYLFFLVSPALWLIWQVPVMSPASTASYLAYSLPYAGSIFALLLLYGGWRGIRSVQQQFYLAPVFLVSAGRAATGIRFRSGVTDKGSSWPLSSWRGLSWRWLTRLRVRGRPSPGRGSWRIRSLRS
jgi:cellulose synthase (UDP-forming)